MRLTIVAAVSRNGVIGANGDLPWSMPSDLKRFRDLTMGHPLVMGRRTWDSIGRPLPGRRTIVVSRSLVLDLAAADVAPSFEAAMSRGREVAGTMGVSEVFVVGGREIYAQALSVAQRLHLTTVEAEVNGDIRFPEIDPREFLLVSEAGFAEPGDEYSATLRIFDRAQ